MMKRAVIAMLLVTTSSQADADAQQRFEVPSPPPPPYHPQPGPYAVVVDDNGNLLEKQRGVIDQQGILDNAWASWRGPKLEAFAVCYTQADGARINWTAALRGLDNVSAALRKRGAVAVVTRPSRACETAIGSMPKGASYVQIVGMLRAW